MLRGMSHTPTKTDITRRSVLRTAAMGSLALAAGANKLFGQARSAPPNIVFITIVSWAT